MRKRILYLSIWLVIITTISATLHITQPLQAFTRWNANELEKSLENALTQPIYGSRFSEFNISVSNCTLTYTRRDVSSCEQEGRLTSYETFVDLRHFRISEKITTLENFNKGGIGIISFTPRRRYADSHMEKIQNLANILNNEKETSGPGSMTASIATRKFLERNPIETIHAWEEIGNCRGEKWISLDDLNLRVHYDELLKFKADIQTLNNICSSGT